MATVATESVMFDIDVKHRFDDEAANEITNA